MDVSAGVISCDHRYRHTGRYKMFVLLIIIILLAIIWILLKLLGAAIKLPFKILGVLLSQPFSTIFWIIVIFYIVFYVIGH